MTTIHTLFLILHVLVGAMIIGLVMLQRGKGADAGAAFGAGVSGTVFGARGSSNFLSRATAVLATVFFTTSLVLAYLTAQDKPSVSVMDAQAGIPAAAPAPLAVPAEPGELPALQQPVAPAAPQPLPALPETPKP
jgi:preprotein translocase subunit SecG